MDAISLLLIIGLLLGAVLLPQLIMQFIRSKTAPMQYRRSTAPPALSTFLPPAPAPADKPGMPRGAPAPQPHVRRPRRFSRARLLRNRSAVQDAVVIAAILEPCHAHRRDV